MTTVGIVGGQLQGLEAVYLARQAGFKAALIDKDPRVPARALSDVFHRIDVLKDEMRVGALMKTFDLVLPANENYQVLAKLGELSSRYGFPLALDLPAYRISSSKRDSNALFARFRIPMPEPWPECGLPVIVKPSGLSGSAGVVRVEDEAHLAAVLDRMGSDTVVQQYLGGPSYSLEVLAHHGQCVCLQVTELHFDAGYDCKRVLAGPDTGSGVTAALCLLGERLASALSLSGIMDIEVIDDRGGLKVLEIDARLPSQTPTAVYHSTGVNIVALLVEYWRNGTLPSWSRYQGKRQAVLYEHWKFRDGILEVSGEHILAGAQRLGIFHNRFSTDVLISNCDAFPSDWVATAVFTGETESRAWEKRKQALRELSRAFPVSGVVDPKPGDQGSRDDTALLRYY
ncbi:MAG: 3-methylornithine--L-lysine ligase PylC [Thermodesulfovibrionales bacterium]